MDILRALREALPDLPRKLSLAARYALDNPDRMALDSMRRTANNVGVTSTTMLRLARQLGFEGYDEFRESFQSQLVSGGFGARAGALRELDAEGPGETLSEQILLSAEANIRQVRADLKQTELNELAQLMLKAPHVYLVGSGAVFWSASIMKSTGNMILPNLRLVGSEFALAAEDMGNLGPEDVVICFALTPTAQRTIEAMRYARERGAHTVAVTDRASSPIAEGAKFLFFGQTDSPHYYPSMAPLILLIETILATVVAQGDGRELHQINALDEVRQSSGFFVGK